MKIIQYTSKHRDQVKPFVLSVLAEFGFPRRPTLDADLENPRWYFLHGGGFYILEYHERLIGTVAYKPIDAATAEIKRLYVHKDYRGKGYGGRLLEYVLSKCKRAGFQKVILDTSERLPEALRLYASRGFIEEKRQRKMIYMSLNLKNKKS